MSEFNDWAALALLDEEESAERRQEPEQLRPQKPQKPADHFELMDQIAHTRALKKQREEQLGHSRY